MAKKILGSIALIGCGIFMISVADQYVYKLFYLIPIDFRIIGGLAILGAIGNIIAAVKERKGTSSKSQKTKAQTAAAKPAAQSYSTAASSQPRPAAAQPRPAAAPTQTRPVPQPQPHSTSAQSQPRKGMTSQEAAEKVRQHTEKSAEQCRANLEALENHFTNSSSDPNLLLPSLMAAYDSFLRSRGSYTFDNYQYRFYAALRAIHKEEQYGVTRSTRRFWVVHSAVHGGIAAGKAKDLSQLEAALQMLERPRISGPRGTVPWMTSMYRWRFRLCAAGMPIWLPSSAWSAGITSGPPRLCGWPISCSPIRAACACVI